MKPSRLIIKPTSDGSTTIYDTLLDEHYHSIHGAVQESQHVFIKNGLAHIIERSEPNKSINILEVGFGTGLNCLLSHTYLKDKKYNVTYTGIEPNRVSNHLLEKLNYSNNTSDKTIFTKLHLTEWGNEKIISSHFHLIKHSCNIQHFNTTTKYDLVYFDAFGPRVEKELWKVTVFKKIHELMNYNGILVTYCAKGQVRRDLIDTGFKVERLEGPPGKREMLRAIKSY
jgi:tRNA U34 5-methylaminomethyl-2-thiouridine-forming methyltransferase MnmC